MAKIPIYVKINKELEDEFRMKVLRRLGPGKIKAAIEEAIKLWIKE